MITLTVPAASASINLVDLAGVFIDVRNLNVTFTYDQTDANGLVTRGVAMTMAGAAFATAFVAASGSFKTRLYTVFQGLVPAFAGPVT